MLSDPYEATMIKILNRLAQTAGWPDTWEPRYVVPNDHPGVPYYSGGYREIPVTLPEDRQLQRCDEARRIIAAMSHMPPISQGYSYASYLTVTDEIILPDRRLFHSEEGFYATIFHELAHATGHATRLDRPYFTQTADLPDEERVEEEIVAELAAAFLCDRAGILDSTIVNMADYLRKWAAVRDPENTACPVVDASSYAQEAADWILGNNAAWKSADLVRVHATLSPD